MPAVEDSSYRLVERSGPGRRVQWRQDAAGRSAVVVVSGYRGIEPPPTLTQPQIESRGAGAWRISSGEGSVDFTAHAVDAIESRPALFTELHRPFALNARDRLAARCLLILLRLPGGAHLLRRWHAKRST